MNRIVKILMVLVLPFALFAQNTITGTVSDAANGNGLAGANVVVGGTALGAAADADGYFVVENVPNGTYTLTASVIGYENGKATITVPDAGSIDFALETSALQLSAVTVAGNFARERETPVAFTTIGEDHIKNNFTVQDVPHLFANTPGVYVTSDGGAGMGDSKVFIRGFDEQRIAVMINNVPVNDPESKKVYWSNWGSLPSASQAIQVQRGVGSSLYGSGALGGSINVVTKDAPADQSLGAIVTLGENGVMKYGASYNSGLVNSKYSFIGRVNYMEGNGWRNNTYFKGMQYYFSGMMYPNEKNVIKFILHGAPQYHAYAYYGMPAPFFADRDEISAADEDAYKDKYGAYASGFGYDASAHPYINEDDDLDGSFYEDRGTKLSEVLFNQTEVGNSPQGGAVIGNGNVSLDNNVFHKPQFEMHHSLLLNDITKITSTAFFSNGHGYGENVIDYFRVPRLQSGPMDPDKLLNGGYYGDNKVYQSRSYSLHKQLGLLSNIETKYGDHDLSGGIELRWWQSRHSGEVLNTFANDDITYYMGNVGQKFSNGDLYYDYTTTKPQVTGFVHALWKFGKLNVMTDLQAAYVTYNIAEDVPNSNNYPDDPADHGGDTWTGTGDATYTLWNYDRDFTYVSPKFGVNYNVNDELNVFANFSRAINEPRVKFFFNYGSPNEELELENTNDIELGSGYKANIAGMALDVKLNWYYIMFNNKALRVLDPTKANAPGYDYKGRRYLPIGSSVYTGTELAVNLAPIPGLSLGLNVTVAANEWGEPDDSEGSQYLYSNDDVVAGTDFNDTDGDGSWDAGETAKHSDFVDKFGNKIEVGMPQIIIGGTANYTIAGFTVGVAFRRYQDIYILENNGDALVGPGDDELYFTDDDEESAVIPSANVIDLVARYSLPVLKGVDLSLHVTNLLDTKYWQTGDSYGFKPGAARYIVLNAGVTL